MLILNGREVEALLDLDSLVEALAAAMADLSAGAASLPPRVSAQVPEQGAVLGGMLAYLPSSSALAAKLVSVFPRNAAAGRHTHQAVITVFDPATGTPLALMDGTYITATRTAAGSALATRLLARPEGGKLAILGTGVQARAHARAIPRVRPITEVVVAGRDERKARALAAELSRELGLPVRAAGSYAEALAEADIVCATTHSPEPVVRREWLRPGVHINSVGVNWEGREVDPATVGDALVVVESRSAALAAPPALGANDLIWPVRDGLIAPADIVEVGELIGGARVGRSSPAQITLYKSVGVAVQDAAAAALVLAAARDRRMGAEVGL
jgi:ornithine cyclodeaminase